MGKMGPMTNIPSTNTMSDWGKDWIHESCTTIFPFMNSYKNKAESGISDITNIGISRKNSTDTISGEVFWNDKVTTPMRLDRTNESRKS